MMVVFRRWIAARSLGHVAATAGILALVDLVCQGALREGKHGDADEQERSFHFVMLGLRPLARKAGGCGDAGQLAPGRGHGRAAVHRRSRPRRSVGSPAWSRCRWWRGWVRAAR